MPGKETYGPQCFELDLDPARALRNETEYDAISENFAFYNPQLDVELFISGDRIDAAGRDLLDLATGMNRAALSGVAKAVELLGGSLLLNEDMGIGDTPTGFDVDVNAEVAGPPGIQQRMLVATVVNSVVAILVRFESRTLVVDDLRTLWRNVRADLFLAEPASLG